MAVKGFDCLFCDLGQILHLLRGFRQTPGLEAVAMRLMGVCRHAVNKVSFLYHEQVKYVKIPVCMFSKVLDTRYNLPIEI